MGAHAAHHRGMKIGWDLRLWIDGQLAQPAHEQPDVVRQARVLERGYSRRGDGPMGTYLPERLECR